MLCNVYSPTHDNRNDQNNFVIKLSNMMTPYEYENMILTDEYGFYTNPKLDKIDSMSNENYNHIY